MAINEVTSIDVKTLPPFKRLIMTLGELPTSYLESMTYAELLMWFCNFLQEKVLPTIDNNAEALQDVITYLENLDLQDEVDHKLDEMTEEGTLQEIIADYLNSKAVFGYDNVAGMKSATNLIDGSYTRTLGFYELNDGGSGLYKIRKVTNADTVDEMFLIALSDETLVAELIPLNNEINIIQVGAKNDNSTDIGSIINKITNEKELKVYVPSGTYKVTETISPKENSTINIDGDLNYTGNDTCIKITTGHNIINTKNITSNAICVTLENNTTDTKCMYNKINLRGTLQTSNNHCLYLHSVLRGVCYNEINFDYLLAGTSYYPIHIKTESTGSVVRYINENVISGGVCGRGLYGVYIDTGTNGNNGEVNGMKFEHISFEGVTNAIYLKNVRSSIFNNPRIAEITGTNKIITLNGACDGNIFNILSLIKINQIDISGILYGHDLNNFINGEIAESGGGRIGRNLITNSNGLALEEALPKIKYKNITTAETTYDFNDGDVAQYIVVNSTSSPTIKLNSYYGSKGLNELFIKPQQDKPFVLKDSYNTTILSFDGTSSTALQHYICYDLNGTDTWIKIG